MQRWRWIHAREYVSGAFSACHSPDLWLVRHADRVCGRVGMKPFRCKQGALDGMNLIQNDILDFGVALEAACRREVILYPQFIFQGLHLSEASNSAAKSF